MSRIIVLFNLKPGVSVEDYERWARSTDLPTVNKLSSISEFRVFKSTGLLAGDGAPPFQYIEILDVADMGAFAEDIQGDAMQAVAAEFQSLADNPCFINTDEIL